MALNLVFATNNAHKLYEIKQLLGTNFNLLSLSDINCSDEIPEDYETLEENAMQKAQYIYDRYQLNSFADDTGLEVEALNGRPGVYSARYAGPQRNSSDNITLLLSELNGKTNRNAQFRTVIALILNDKKYYFEGVVKGIIIEKPIGANGFGYDPVFVPEGYNQTFAQLPIEIKNTISHRGLAFVKLLNHLTM